MRNTKSSVLVLIKTIKYILIAAVLLILIAVVVLYKYNTRREYEDKSILNIFGKQRIYTQMMGKDANRLYYLVKEKNQVNIGEAEVQINKEIASLRINLQEERDRFASNLEAFHNYHIYINGRKLYIDAEVINQSEYLKQIDVLWEEFDFAIHEIIEADNTQEIINGARFINNNNLLLLSLSDSLFQQVQDSTIKADRRYEHLAYTLIGLQVFIIIVSLIGLSNYLFRPYYQLYTGLSEIGLTNMTTRNNIPTRRNVKPMVDEVNGIFLKITNLISLIENMNNNNSFMEILTYINKTFSTFIPFNYIGIALMSNDKKMIKASYGVTDGSVTGLTEKLMGLGWYLNETSLDQVLESGEARIINDLEQYCEGAPLKLYNKMLLEFGIRASIALPLKVNKEPVGMIFFSSINKNVYTKEHSNFLSTLANSIAISLNQNIITKDIIFSSILALAKLSEARDEDTGEHMERMAKYSRLISKLLYENELYTDIITLEYIDKIYEFSPLHDIGKVGIMDDILLKPGKLTEKEFIEMKRHAQFGGQVLRTADKKLHDKGKSLFAIGIEIAEAHHEKWDGSGYPFGKKGEEIPLSARIVAVADVFDALTSKRPYKEAFPLEDSFRIIEEGKGKHFDPTIVDVVLQNRDQVENLYRKFNRTKG